MAVAVRTIGLSLTPSAGLIHRLCKRCTDGITAIITIILLAPILLVGAIAYAFLLTDDDD